MIPERCFQKFIQEVIKNVKKTAEIQFIYIISKFTDWKNKQQKTGIFIFTYYWSKKSKSQVETG